MPLQSSSLDPRARWRSANVENRQDAVMMLTPTFFLVFVGPPPGAAKDVAILPQKSSRAILVCKKFHWQVNRERARKPPAPLARSHAGRRNEACRFVF